MVVVSLIALCVFTALKYRDYQKGWISEQQRSPGELLTQQYARLLSPLMQNEDSAGVNAALKVLTSDNRVLQAGVFDSRGVQIAPQDRLSSLMSQTGLAVTHVQDIKNDAGSVLGYIRVLTRHSTENQEQELLHSAQWLLMLTICIVGFFAGVYLARSFYKLRPVIKARYHALGRSPSFPTERNRRR